jgi:FkbM family methyltransferase
MSVLFSRSVGPTGSVHAFEADPFIYSALERNLAANHCTNVIPYHAAVWHSAGLELSYPEPDFTRFDSYGSYGIDPNSNGSRTVSSLTIDSLGLSAVDLIKIDIQGSDLNAMRGAVATIAKFKPLIVFEYESLFDAEFGVSWADYLEFISSIGYTISDTIGGVNLVIEHAA